MAQLLLYWILLILLLLIWYDTTEGKKHLLRKWRKKIGNIKKGRKSLHLEILIMIHKGIENSEYWSYEGVTDLLTEIYWQVEEVMERHPEINDTQELVGKWMTSYTSQWLHLRTEGVTPTPLSLEKILQYKIEKELSGNPEAITFMRAVGEMNDRLKRTDYEIEKTEKWLKDTNRQIMSNYELMKYYLNEVKELRRQEDIEQAVD